MTDKFRKKLIKGKKGFTEEEVAHQVSEDRRLVELGIDPDGNPVDIMRRLYEIKDEQEKKNKKDD